MRDSLARRHCRPCEDGDPPLAASQARKLLARVTGWKLAKGRLVRVFAFKNYYQTTAFVNAVAWIAHREDHHPDIEFGYKSCTVRYSTHSVGGLSDNDFICAAHINALQKT